MKSKLFAALFLLAGSSLFAGPRIAVGVGVGFGGGYGYYAPGPPPPPVVAYAPAIVRPGYSWEGAYRFPAGPRDNWRSGYWARPPYASAHWVAPRHYAQRYYGGYWRR